MASKLFFFGHREVGIIIKNVDISSGGVTVNLNEGLLLKSKSSSEPPSGSDRVIESSTDSVATKKPAKRQQALASFSKYSSMFPEKVANFDIVSVSNHHICALVTMREREYKNDGLNILLK